jgi:hypothetical protein
MHPIEPGPTAWMRDFNRIVGAFVDLPSLSLFRSVKHVTSRGKFLTAIRAGLTSALTCEEISQEAL